MGLLYSLILMNVFSFEADCDHYQNLDLVDEEADWEIIYQFNGTPIGPRWRRLPVEPIDEEADTEQPLPPSDCPSLFPGAPVLSRRACEILQPILQGNGELLPLECEEGDYSVFNVTRVVDALDETMSEIVRFPDGKKVMTVKRFAFISASLENIDVFKLPQLPLSRPFVTDRFVHAVRANGLTGFSFEWLWSSEQDSSSSLQATMEIQ